jgi:hypothetical protein
MFWAVLAHIVVPGMVILSFAGFSLAARRTPITWNYAVDIAVDLTILAIGATGALFVDPRLIQAYGQNNALVALTVMVTNICLASILMLFRRRVCMGDEAIPPRPVSWKLGIMSLFIGFMALFVVGSVVAWSYLKAPTNPANGKVAAPAAMAIPF